MKRTIVRWYPLFLISAMGLFLEMAVIRWISAEVRLYAYFKNLALLAAFLGLAIGFGLAGRARDYRRSFLPLLAYFLFLALLVGRFASPNLLAYPGNADEFLWFTADVSQWAALLLFTALLLIFFLLIVFLFIPLGQATGQEMEGRQPVRAYITNLSGSLLGIWLFALLSYLRTPPFAWFGLAMLGIGGYLATKRKLSWIAVILSLLALLGLAVVEWGTIWSPYNRLDVEELAATRASDGEKITLGFELRVQQVFYQTAFDLSAEALDGPAGGIPDIVDMADFYDLPYHLVGEGPDVLVVGAGMGNDVAAALRHGARHVDAVEIDPAILALGRELHPEAPYADDRVTAHINDARSFFELNTKQYDVVAFGLLDSHTLLSSLSSVRLDSFVYTVDSFEQVRQHLEDDGLISVSFAVGAPWIEQRIGQMMMEVFGDVYIRHARYGTVFLAGAVPTVLIEQHELSRWQPDPDLESVPLATDDWPYLYLRTRKVPAAYWQALLAIGLVCLVIIVRTFPRALRPNGHFWLLGAAFLLVEFKSITEFALLFGTTWLVNVLAVSGVLLMAVAANLVVLWRKRIRVPLAYTLLFASLGLNYLFPLDLLNALAPGLRAISSMILLSLPLFFAGLIFSECLRRARDAAGPLASNLSGSVAGGVLEYGSLMWGIKSLYLIAGAVYVGALIAYIFRRER